MGAANTGRLDIVKLLVSRGASWRVANKVLHYVMSAFDIIILTASK